MLTAGLKFFGGLVHPVCLVWLAAVGGAVWTWRRKQRLGAGLLAGLAVFLYVAASRLSLELVARLEAPYLGGELAALAPGDAVVLLGGGVGFSKNDPLGMNLNDAADRLFTALELARQQKAPVLVLGGGGDPADATELSEAATVRRWVERQALPGLSVEELGVNRNTHDEAVKTAALAQERGWRRVFLVTSAAHMRRAEATFRKAGVPVVPVACDFHRPGTARTEGFNPWPWPPGIELLDIYLHEQAGWLVYWLRGWVGGEPPAAAGPGPAATGGSKIATNQLVNPPAEQQPAAQAGQQNP